MATTPSSTSAPPRGWPLFLLGVVVFLLGPIANAVQLLVLHWTVMPWLSLGLVSAGVLLMVLSLVQRFSILRTLGTVLFALPAGMMWLFLLVLARTPHYDGPAQVGAKLPEFETKLADGSTFRNADLAGAGGTIFLFFRGHW